MADLETRGWLVAGRVQGVFFRASTRSQAELLGLSGRAVNLDDGRVEVIARGEPGALEQLEAWLRQGPPAAQVTEVKGIEDASVRRLPDGRFDIA
jgi:acylphosphatase